MNHLAENLQNFGRKAGGVCLLNDEIMSKFFPDILCRNCRSDRKKNFFGKSRFYGKKLLFNVFNNDDFKIYKNFL